MKPISYEKQLITQDNIDAVVDVMKSDFLTDMQLDYVINKVLSYY